MKTASERWEYPEDAYSVWTLPLAISRVVSRPPFTNNVEKGWKNVQTLWWAELDRLHSMTRAHPPLRDSRPFSLAQRLVKGQLRQTPYIPAINTIHAKTKHLC